SRRRPSRRGTLRGTAVRQGAPRHAAKPSAAGVVLSSLAAAGAITAHGAGDVTVREVPAQSRDPFGTYACNPDQYDEAFMDRGSPRVPHAPIVEFLRRFTGPELTRLQQTVHALLREQGITFSLLGDEGGLERTLPLDPVPRVIAATEWRTLERGCAQRVR